MFIYVAHPIRGDGSPGAIENNCVKARALEHELRTVWPWVTWYVPGTQDLFPQTAMNFGYLTVDQVLNIDCFILCKHAHGILVCTWSPSQGVQGEVELAQTLKLPQFICLQYPNRDELTAWLEGIRREQDGKTPSNK